VSLRGLVLAALVAALAAPASAFGAGSVRDGGGQYLVSAGAGGSTTDSAMEFGTASFSDSVSVTSTEGPPRSTASSGMVASVTDGTDRLTLDGNASLACQQPANGPGSGASARFERTFDVTAAGGVRFNGTITASGTSLNAFLLDEDEQPVLGVDDPGSDSESGTLAPGEYTLSIQVNCLVETFTAEPASTSGGFDVLLEVGGGGDGDGDGLLDDWELNGYDPDGPGGEPALDLAAMGAEVDHKDIFLELDFMPPHRLEQAAIDEVVQAFAAAPVGNPDGTQGIELHVDNGPAAVMDPSSGALWGTLSDQDSVTHDATLGSMTPGSPARYEWGEFDVVKLANFADEREAVFHYAISAHGHAGTSSGIARAIPSSDLLVTLGAGCQALRGSDCTLEARAQAGTLMHELGHNLGLRHGGDDDDPYKPNYLSVMNYAFQLGGLYRADLSTRLDYSRFALPPLNENALDEAHGFGQSAGSAPANNTTLGFCPSGRQTPWRLVDGPLDFDCDGAFPEPGTVTSDVNKDGGLTVLDSFVDWPNLVYNGGAVGGSGIALPTQTELIEPPFEELLLGQQTIEAYAASLRGTPGSAGGPPATGGGGGGSSQAAPVRLSGLRIKPASLRSATRGRSIVRRGGAKVSYRLSGAAAVTFRVERRHGGRWVRVRGRFKQAGKSGANSLRFSGRVGGKRLRAGRYRLVAIPQGGPPARAAFRVR
jgi:hypothetical protein